MFKALKWIAIVLVVVMAAFVAVVAMQPNEFRVERSAIIAATPADVFPHVNDFHKWQAWSPWAKLDPNAKNTFEGPANGVGAIFKWAGNSDVGVGGMTITESKPNDCVKIRLDFQEPFEDTSDVEFTFKPEGSNTVVTWSMFGKNNFVSKIFCLFMDMDKMIGGKFEEGLASLKSVATAPSPK